MNKFSQRVITISIIIMTTFSILAYLEVKKIKKNVDWISSKQNYIDYNVEEIKKDLNDVNYNISTLDSNTSTSSYSNHDFSEDIYYYVSEIYEIMKKRY